MDIGTCKLLARYNQAANTEMNALIGKLDNTRWTKEFEGYFKSIRDVCNHIYIADFNWLNRFGKLRDFDYAKDSMFAGDISFDTVYLKDIKDYPAKREELDKMLVRFAEQLRPDDFEMTLSYSDSRGVMHSRNFGGLILHVFNHQTHHRGMVSIYLDFFKIANDFSNIVPLV
jgi:uncharacterized damage-inducible protein DinB